jgi:hypothetical protein
MDWVVNATPLPFYPRKRPGTHCIRGWVGPRAGLDGCRKPRYNVVPKFSIWEIPSFSFAKKAEKNTDWYIMSLLGPDNTISTLISNIINLIYRLRVFENRVLGKICGPKRKKGTEKWGKNCINDGLHDLQSTLHFIRAMKSKSGR